MPSPPHISSRQLTRNVYDAMESNIAPYVKAFSKAVPSFNEAHHKGQHGRVGVIGGCEQYTGAPFFASIAALRTGADLAHVFCASDAAASIKSFSADLIVHPILDRPHANEYLSDWIGRMHALVIGPGLGRDQSLLPVLMHLILKAKSLNLPLVFDADALYFLNQNISLIQGYSKAILTPNIAEFGRLYTVVVGNDGENLSITDKSAKLANKLGNVTLLVKGAVDVVTDGHSTVTSNEPGSGRRCGGQGDILSGSVGTFACWTDKGCGQLSATMTACVAASILTRSCNLLAFKKYGRSMITSDMIKFIGQSFNSLVVRF